jgi:hypothetical protein
MDAPKCQASDGTAILPIPDKFDLPELRRCLVLVADQCNPFTTHICANGDVANFVE